MTTMQESSVMTREWDDNERARSDRDDARSMRKRENGGDGA